MATHNAANVTLFFQIYAEAESKTSLLALPRRYSICGCQAKYRKNQNSFLFLHLVLKKLFLKKIKLFLSV